MPKLLSKHTLTRMLTLLAQEDVDRFGDIDCSIGYVPQQCRFSVSDADGEAVRKEISTAVIIIT